MLERGDERAQETSRIKRGEEQSTFTKPCREDGISPPVTKN
jgi:hypothetical protein